MSREPCPTEESRGSSDRDDAEFCAVIEEYADRPNQCTIYPRDSSGIDRMSTWITAREGAFVSLEDAR